MSVVSKQFSGTLLCALIEERNFGLVDRLRLPTWARFESFGSGTQSNPAISSITHCDQDSFYSNSLSPEMKSVLPQVFARLMPRADLHLGDHARIFVTLAFDEVGGKKAGPRPGIDKDVADGHEGFVELGGNLHNPHPGWDVIVGRQEIVLGTGRLLDDNEGVNVRSAFDGVRIGYEKPKGRIDLIVARPVQTNPDAWDDVPDPAISLWGAYASNVRWHSQFMSDVYFLDYDSKLAAYGNESAREHRMIGARYFNRLPGEEG
jgi:Alginate export